MDNIAKNFNDRGLGAMRATCRDLYDGSTYKPLGRFTSSKVEILCARCSDTMRKLSDTVRLPDPAKVQIDMAQLLAKLTEDGCVIDHDPNPNPYYPIVIVSSSRQHLS